MSMDETQVKIEYAIETHELWRTYRIGPKQEVHALRGIDLQIERGKLVALKGRSGSGKTTLLNCVGGLDKPTKGTITTLGTELSNLSERQIVRFHRQQVGFVFQAFGLTPTYSAYENIELILRIAGMRWKARRERAQEMLELVGLTKWRNHRPSELSGGQQQRVAIARALANKPRLLLADEPTGKLDTATARDILSLFRRITQQEGITVVLASHDPLVDEYVDTTLRLQDGQLAPN